jgi:pimeloyl-ACP methyl ester carboxylesterase
VTYNHRISVRRIGQLLARWNFIPAFASRSFTLSPTLAGQVVAATGQAAPFSISSSSRDQQQQEQFPVIVLAHGYLGSRFDLSHLAERLATRGFVCVAPEYPESLAASYERKEGLDRSVITQELLQTLQDTWKIHPSSFGIIGHSLGCGTCLSTGDSSWTRILISGGPPREVQRNGQPMPESSNILYITSTNDGVTSRFSGSGTVPRLPAGYQLLDEDQVAALLLARSTSSSTDPSTTAIKQQERTLLPSKALFQINRPDGPNHISFLAEGVNNAMVDFLSPLLPLAQAMNIPVLDFDRYQQSRDSVATAQAYQPLVIAYLEQYMM